MESGRVSLFETLPLFSSDGVRAVMIRAGSADLRG
jgi:hypothetical protein